MKLINNIKCYSPDKAYANEFMSSELISHFVSSIESNFWYQSRNNLILGLLEKYLSDKEPKKSVLEIGCGTGFVLQALWNSEKNYSLTGVDIYLESLNYIRKSNPNINLIQGDITEISDDIGKYHAVGMFDVLEHIEDDVSMLKKVKANLMPEGLLFMTIPQHQFLWSAVDEINLHKRRYSRSELISKLQEAGYEITFISSFSFSVFPLLLVSRYLDRIKSKLYKNYSKNSIIDKELNINKFVSRILKLLLSIDLRLISYGISLPFGGSLVVVALPKFDDVK